MPVTALTLQNGVVIGVRSSEEEGEVQFSRRGGSGGGATQEFSFKERIAVLRQIAREFHEGLADFNGSPDKVTVSFGVEFGAGTSVYVVQADASANFQVTLEWCERAPDASSEGREGGALHEAAVPGGHGDGSSTGADEGVA